jgi:hypothetical protein
MWPLIISKEGSWQRSGCRRPRSTYVVVLTRPPPAVSLPEAPRPRAGFGDPAKISALEILTLAAVARHGIQYPGPGPFFYPPRRSGETPLYAHPRHRILARPGERGRGNSLGSASSLPSPRGKGGRPRFVLSTRCSLTEVAHGLNAPGQPHSSLETEPDVLEESVES